MKKQQKEFGKSTSYLSGIAITPDIGQGNPTETKAVAASLEAAGLEMHTSFPRGFWVALGSRFHIAMTANTDKTIRYAQGSSSERSSWKTKPLLWELQRAVKKAKSEFPEAAFVITPQNMLAETAYSSSSEIPIIMVLPDAMGKLNPNKKATKVQKALPYLVWNEQAQAQMQQRLGIKNVQLIPLIDPLLGFQTITKREIQKRKFSEVLEEGNLCFIKLSGSGGDSKLINTALTALWKNSAVRSIVFPGQRSTQKKLIKKVDRRVAVKSSLDEGLFYNLSRNMIVGEQMFLTYPSEQFKHMMVLSKEGKKPSVVWLPPRGEHEVVNLAEFLFLSSQQGLTATILLPTKYHADLHRQLANFGFSQNLHYEFVTPEALSKKHFKTVPLWQEKLPRTSLPQAVKNILLAK